MFDETNEAATTSTQHHSLLNGFIRWLVTIVSIIVLTVAFYGIYQVRAVIPYVGMVWIICASLVPAIGIAFLLKYLLRSDVIHIGETGTILKLFNCVTLYHPLGIKEYRAHGTQEHTTEETVKIPELLYVLRDGLIDGASLLLGFYIDGTAKFGTWEDLRTFVVAGKSRSGKTTTMVFFIVQALIAHAQVYICDPHYTKKTGLLNVIAPLIPFLHVARTKTEIMQAVTEFLNEMKLRENGTSTMLLSEGVYVPMLLVVDEWTKLIRELDNVEIEIIVNTVLGCAELYAGYNGYALIGGQEWTARESGGKHGASIRRAFHSVFVHRLDEDYAKFLLTGKNKKLAKTAPNLPTGNAYFQDSEGENSYLIIPYYGARKEGIYEVVEMLRTIDAAPSNKLLTTPDNTLLAAPSPTRNTDANIEAVTEITVSSDEEKVRLVQRLRKRNVAHRDIAYTFGWYGARYNEYQAFCERYNIPLVETAKKEYIA